MAGAFPGHLDERGTGVPGNALWRSGSRARPFEAASHEDGLIKRLVPDIGRPIAALQSLALSCDYAGELGMARDRDMFWHSRHSVNI
jgi:hypothetical protein